MLDDSLFRKHRISSYVPTEGEMEEITTASEIPQPYWIKSKSKGNWKETRKETRPARIARNIRQRLKGNSLD